VKIAFEGHVPVPHDEMLRHVAHAHALGLPLIREAPPHERPLAVVGGGPSITNHLAEIRGFSDVWAINGACRFLRENDIESTLVSVDPCDFLAPRVSGAKRAILASRCHPDVFAALADADVQIFDLVNDVEGGHIVSTATAMMAFSVAPFLGYRRVVFFGCEGSYTNRTHAYMDEAELQEGRFTVEVDGRRFDTSPDLYMLTTAMTEVMRLTVPGAFMERSGGLLRALVECPTHDIVAVSESLKRQMRMEPCQT
jgi:hypothetical protein